MSEEQLRKRIEFLSKIWLGYREEIYADQVDQIVWKSPKRLILRSGCLERTTRKRPHTSSPLMRFPDHLCKRPRDKIVLLNFLQCNVAVTHMRCVLDWLLKDMCARVEVVVFLLKEPPLIVTIEPDGGLPVSNSSFQHICWRITLKSGERFAVDLTGAQYGWFDPVCNWKECLKTRCLYEGILRVGVSQEETIAPLIAAESGISGFTPPGVDNYYASIQETFSKLMTAHLEKSQATRSLALLNGTSGIDEADVIAEVRRQVDAAIMIADEVWNTFPWKEIHERIDMIDFRNVKLITGMLEHCGG